jgi:glutamate 5-kinase
MVICDGTALSPIAAIRDSARSTWFIARENPPHARKMWIAAGLNPVGTLLLDDGAIKALKSGKSLLAAGIKTVKGRFNRGDLVAVATLKGVEAGRGIINYSAEDAVKIAGCNSREIQSILGYRGRDEVIHADDLVMMD